MDVGGRETARSETGGPLEREHRQLAELAAARAWPVVTGTNDRGGTPGSPIEQNGGRRGGKGSEREESNLVTPLLRFGGCPDRQQIVNGGSNIKVLRDNDQAWTRAVTEKPPEVHRHGLSVMRNQDSAERGSSMKNHGIGNTDHAARVRVLEVDRRLAPPQTKNDFLVKVRVSLEPRSHAVGLGAPWRAASSFA